MGPLIQLPDDDSMNQDELQGFLEEYYDLFNRPDFIDSDPIRIPHGFSKKEDIEISGFLAAILAWGQRQVIIRNASSLVENMPGGPHEFLLNATDTQLETFIDFKHRTFNGTDAIFFLRSLRNIYREHQGLEGVFSEGFGICGNIPGALH